MSSPVANNPIVPGNTLSRGDRFDHTEYRRFRAQLKNALAHAGSNGLKGLRRVADKLVESALKGEGWAILAIRDTLDGKPAQTVQLAPGSTSYVVMIPVQPDSIEQWERNAVTIVQPSTASTVPVGNFPMNGSTEQPPAGTEPDPSGGVRD